MSCLSSAARAAIRAEIIELDAMIAIVKAAYISSLTNSEVEEYRFDSGDGSQRATRRSPKEIKAEWDDLASSRNRLLRKLNGTSNVNMNLRRRRYGFGRYGRYNR